MEEQSKLDRKGGQKIKEDLLERKLNRRERRKDEKSRILVLTRKEGRERKIHYKSLKFDAIHSWSSI